MQWERAEGDGASSGHLGVCVGHPLLDLCPPCSWTMPACGGGQYLPPWRLGVQGEHSVCSQSYKNRYLAGFHSLRTSVT